MSVVAGIWVKSLTGSSALAGLVSASVYLPSLFGPIGGLIADRVPRRRLLIGLNIASSLRGPSCSASRCRGIRNRLSMGWLTIRAGRAWLGLRRGTEDLRRSGFPFLPGAARREAGPKGLMSGAG